MVHLDKVEGQRGSMVMQEDGSIISSTGTLASSEQASQTILSILSHTLQVDFNGQPQQQNGHVNNAAVSDNGNNLGGAPVLKWSRLTVSFPDHSYVACLSNKKIHVVDRDSSTPQEDAEKNVLVVE